MGKKKPDDGAPPAQWPERSQSPGEAPTPLAEMASGDRGAVGLLPDTPAGTPAGTPVAVRAPASPRATPGKTPLKVRTDRRCWTGCPQGEEGEEEAGGDD